MILVADNDALLKLNAYALWDDTCALLGVRQPDVRTLAAARFVVRRFRDRADMRLKYTAGGIDRALAAIEHAAIVDPPSDMTDHDALLMGARRLNPTKPPVDPGEALLFAAAAPRADYLLTTSDKRALRALHALPEAKTVCDQLAGRILCVEHLLLELIEARGFAYVQPRVRSAPECDGVIRIAFGASAPAPEASVRDGLHSFIGDLRSETGALLAPPRSRPTGG